MTGNNDLTGQPANPVDLNLPEVLTEADLLANLDMSNLLSQSLNLDINDKLQNFGTDWTSTLHPESGTQSRLTPEDRPQLEDDTGLDLDLGEDGIPLGGNDTSMSIEVGRDAPAARPIGEELFSDDKVLDGNDLDLDLGDDLPMREADTLGLGAEGEINNLNVLGDDDGMDIPGDETLQLQNAGLEIGARRLSKSPLSDVGRGLDHTFNELEGGQDEVATRQPQR